MLPLGEFILPQAACEFRWMSRCDAKYLAGCKSAGGGRVSHELQYTVVVISMCLLIVWRNVVCVLLENCWS